MDTIKLGSKSSAVKILQEKLGLTADGIFGKNTQLAVIDFQKKHNLIPDGIVGNTTWRALGIQLESKCIDSSIVYKPLSIHITKCSRVPKYIAIHFTAGSNSQSGKALSYYSVFTSRNASADFVVDDTTVVQFNPDINNYYCWAVGDKKNTLTKGGKLYNIANNRNTISIEMCSNCTPSTTKALNTPNHTGWYFTDKTISNAIKLTKLLMKKYNIPISRVVRHYDITGKLCPGVKGWNDYYLYTPSGQTLLALNNSTSWTNFLNKI